MKVQELLEKGLNNFKLVDSYNIETTYTKHNVKIFKRNASPDIQKINEDEKLLIDFIVGSSRVSSFIVPEQSFENPKEILLEKLGLYKKPTTSKMVMGNIFEQYIADLLQYYEGDIEKTYHNKVNNKKVNTVISNMNTPYILLFNDVIPIKVTPDVEVIFPNETERYPLDLKFVSPYSFKSKELSLMPGQYVWQSVLQQIVFNKAKGYLFYVIGNEDIKIVEIERQGYLPFIDTLIENLKTFYNILEDSIGKSYDEIMEQYPEFVVKEPNRLPEVNRQEEEAEGTEDDEDMCIAYLRERETKKELDETLEKIRIYFKAKYNGYKKVRCGSYIVNIHPFNVRVSSVIEENEE